MFEKTVNNVINLTARPMMLINWTAGLIGGIWLIILGEWRIAVFGVIAGASITFIYPFITMPLLLLTIGGAKLLERKIMMLGMVLLWLGIFIQHIINFIWLLLVIAWAIALASGNSLPYILFGYSVATGPFSYMASKEQPDAIGTYLAVYLAKISYIILAVTFLVGFQSISMFIILPITIIIEIFNLSILKRLQYDNNELQPN